MQKKLYRSRTDSVFAGVCGGIAKYFNVDATLVRVITVVLFLAGSVGFWVYVILGLVIPKEPYAGFMDQYNNNGIDPNGYVDRNMGGYYGDPNANYGGMPYNNGYPNGGYPNNGYQNNGYPNGGYPNNGYQNNGYPNNGFYNGAPNGYYYDDDMYDWDDRYDFDDRFDFDDRYDFDYDFDDFFDFD